MALLLIWTVEGAKGAITGFAGALLFLLASLFVDVRLPVNSFGRRFAYVVGGALTGWVLSGCPALEHVQVFVIGAFWPYVLLHLKTLAPIVKHATGRLLAAAEDNS